jgi:magnesium-transporting ATPase (P-type)
VVLAEQLRPDARETVAFLLQQGVDIRVISGDAPATVAAIAADAGIPIRGEPVDGRELARDEAGMRELARDSTVVGRISPDGKRRYVEALAAQGRYVAMVGDGVNDVPALKAARLAIAQGSGSQMARAVADLVLVKGGFASVPAMIGEGRKLLRNLQRVAKLFVAKSVLAAFLILTVGISSESYPFLPRHLTLASAITIGIPAFFLALAPSEGPWRPTRFLRDLANFAIPAGTAAGLGVVAGYLISINLIDMSEVRARTVATTVLVAVGLYLVVVLEASSKVRGFTVGALCAALFALYFVVLSLPGTRSFFEVAAPDPAIILVSLVGTALAVTGLALTDERFLPVPRPPPPPAAPR